MKNIVRSIASKFDILISGGSHIGVRLENDLSRLIRREDIKTVFDVGANHGQSALRFEKAFPKAEILSFEPVAANFKILNSNCENKPRIRTINKGLGEHSGKVKIGLSQNPGRHSLHLLQEGGDVEEIEISTVDTVMEESDISFIDLLKIDVEGFEIEVLKGGEKALEGNQVRFIFAECIFAPVETYPHTLFEDLTKYLERFGFAFFGCYHESFHLGAGSALANILFVNKKLLPASAKGKFQNIT